MRLIDADALIEEALTEGAYGYVDANKLQMPQPSMPCLLCAVRTAYTVMRSLALYTVLSDLTETAKYRRNFIVQTVKERRMNNGICNTL